MLLPNIKTTEITTALVPLEDRIGAPERGQNRGMTAITVVLVPLEDRRIGVPEHPGSGGTLA